MKILKYILGIILLLILFALIKGLLTPSVSYDSEVTVNKSAKEAWAVMTDESKMSQWINGFERTELVSGTANTPGAVSHVYVVDQGQEMMMKETINSIKENEHIEMNFSMDIMDMVYRMTMIEEGGQTKIRTNSTTKGNGIMYKTMVAFMKGMMKTQEDENLENLKRLIEENTNNYFPEPATEVIGEVEG